MRHTAAACVASALASALLAGCHGLFLRPSLGGETQLETPSYRVRTDLKAEARAVLGAVAEEMRAELEAAYPAPAGTPRPEPRREIVAFAAADDFRKFLKGHLFAQERAIGFYCDLGGECALVWRDPPGPEDVRVLRHELVHQHLAARLAGRQPAWLEEGLAEQYALGPDRVSAERSGWVEFRGRRLDADRIRAALEIQNGLRSWPEAADAPADRVPPPSWAAGEGGYVLHLLFVRWLESTGEGRTGALGACLARAAAGEEAALDLSARFRSILALEQAYHGFVLREGLAALVAAAGGPDDEAREHALRALERLGRVAATDGAARAAAPRAGGAIRLSPR